MSNSFVNPWTVLKFPSPGVFLTHGLNLHFLHWQGDSLPLSQQGSAVARLDAVMYLQGYYALELSLNSTFYYFHLEDRIYNSMSLFNTLNMPRTHHGFCTRDFQNLSKALIIRGGRFLICQFLTFMAAAVRTFQRLCYIFRKNDFMYLCKFYIVSVLINPMHR